MSGFYGQFLDSIGMEYESTALDNKFYATRVTPHLQRVLGNSFRSINLTRDASIEFIAEIVKVHSSYLTINSHTNGARVIYGVGRGNHKTMGFEVYTSPLEVPEFEKVVYGLMYTLMNFGDFPSRRASIHFHFGFVNNLRLLKNLLRVCLMIDPVLYRLGGMGGTFRGNCNLAAYARPLMNSAVVPYSPKIGKSLPQNATNEQLEEYLHSTLSDSRKRNKHAQIINPLSALDSSTIEEFWASFGITYPSGGTVKYHPARYSGINFFAIPNHNTIEFRHFNQCLNPMLVVSIGKFLRGMVEMSSMLGKGEVQQFDVINPNVEISTSDSADIIYRIMDLCRQKEVENLPTDKEISLILDTIENSRFEPLPETPVLTHKPEFTLDGYIVNLGKLKTVKDFLEPAHVDIHNIHQKDVSIFD